MADSPTARTLKLLRKQGWTAAVVEKWNPHVKVRQDLFGFADVIAFDADNGQFLLVQSTSGSNFSSRWKKVCENENAQLWLKAGGRIVVHGWRKAANGRYECREGEVESNDGGLPTLNMETCI